MAAPAAVSSIDSVDGVTVWVCNSAIMPGKAVDLTVDKVSIGAVSSGSSVSGESFRRAMTATSGCEASTISVCPSATWYGATLVSCGGKVKIAV